MQGEGGTVRVRGGEGEDGGFKVRVEEKGSGLEGLGLRV